MSTSAQRAQLLAHKQLIK